MCDYSLHHVASRPAKVSDKLVTTELARSGTRGFAAVGEHGAKLVIHDGPPKVAVCLLPGTELAFDDYVRYDRAFSLFGKARVNHKVARFRQIDMNDPHVQHDALEFPNGQVLKVTRLVAGQTATVLQLPVATQHPEDVETGVVARSSDSRVTLNRAFRPGTASILMPNQGTVMLWQAFRSTAIRLSIALVQSFLRLKAHKQHPILRAALPAGVDAEKIETSFKKSVLCPELAQLRPLIVGWSTLCRADWARNDSVRTTTMQCPPATPLRPSFFHAGSEQSSGIILDGLGQEGAICGRPAHDPG